MTGPKKFPRRSNRDGSSDLICPACFRTVITHKDELVLDAAELNHLCRASDVDMLSGKHKAVSHEQK